MVNKQQNINAVLQKKKKKFIRQKMHTHPQHTYTPISHAHMSCPYANPAVLGQTTAASVYRSGGGGGEWFHHVRTIILGYSQQIHFYSLLKWTMSKVNGERPWGIYAPLQRVPGELIYYNLECEYNILMRYISQFAKYKLCNINQTEISNVWNLRKRCEFFANIALFLFPLCL